MNQTTDDMQKIVSNHQQEALDIWVSNRVNTSYRFLQYIMTVLVARKKIKNKNFKKQVITYHNNN